MKTLNYFILPVNKPQKISSFKTISMLKREYNLNKITMGHTGTLDPFATGVLIILGGKATKLSKFFNFYKKTYFARVIFGKKSTTGDKYGKIINNSFAPPDKNSILNILNKFKGNILQKPHKYSAVKINGKRAYQYSRDNIDIELKPRKIFIYDIYLVHYNYKNATGIFKISCSSGTYIRTLFEDIAEKLGTFAYTDELVRFSIGPFTMSRTLKIKLNSLKCNLKKYLIYPTYNLLSPYIKFFELKDNLKQIFLKGKKINKKYLFKEINLNININTNINNPFYIGFYNKKDLITTILKITNNEVKYSFNYPEII